MRMLPLSIVTAAIALALGGCVSEGPVLSTGTNSPTSDESMPAPGDRSATSGRPVPSPGSEANYREPSDALNRPRNSGAAAGASSPTADESQQAPGDRSNSTGSTENFGNPR